MIEWQTLFDAINVCGSDERRLSQKPAASGAFTLKQMASARAPEKDFAGAGYLESFGYGLSGFNTFGASHMSSFI
jgi:hypothetical protein